MVSEQDILLIQRFIDGDLNEQEEVAFKIRVESSEELSKQVSFQRKLLAEIEARSKSELKEKMLADYRKVKKSKSVGFPKMVWYGAAASVVLVLSFLLWSKLNTNSSEMVFQAYYRPYDGVINTRSHGRSLADGMSAYNAKHFEKALNIFLETKDESLPEAKRYLLIGNCYLNLQEIDSSLLWFNKVTDNENDLIKNNRDWYIALTLLKKGELDKSKIILQRLANTKSSHSQHAIDLLSEDIFN